MKVWPLFSVLSFLASTFDAVTDSDSDSDTDTVLILILILI